MDNPVATAAQAVMVAVPRPPPVWPAFHSTLTTVAATVSGPPRKTAATLRLAVWRRRPGGGSLTPNYSHLCPIAHNCAIGHTASGGLPP